MRAEPAVFTRLEFLDTVQSRSPPAFASTDSCFHLPGSITARPTRLIRERSSCLGTGPRDFPLLKLNSIHKYGYHLEASALSGHKRRGQMSFKRTQNHEAGVQAGAEGGIRRGCREAPRTGDTYVDDGWIGR